MNNIDKQYQKLLQDIIDNGVKKEDRTGTGTISVFGRQIRHKMSDGFPLLTTKKMPFKTIVTELLWFLRGDTNIKYLVDNGCHIWDGDAYKNYEKNTTDFQLENPIDDFIIKTLRGEMIKIETEDGDDYRILTKEEFIRLIKTDDKFAKKWGELGPIYGKQWRKWEYQYGDEYNEGHHLPTLKKQIDQIDNLINELKTNPDSRRLMVSAWNVGELDQMVLPPCHYGFQIYTKELSWEERDKLYVERCLASGDGLSGSAGPNGINYEFYENLFAKYNVPTRAISLMWNQRSVDTFLGLPFNIASYGLLLEIIAKEVNMIPDELIGNLGDVHLYSNHIEQSKEQIGRKLTFDERYKLLSGSDKTWEEGGGNSYGKINGLDMMDDAGIPTRTRQPFELPKLEILDSKVDNISHYEINDFVLKNYQSHPAIKAPLSN
jgi:thymidylate synthase